MMGEEGQRATLVALRRLAAGNGDDGTQNIDGLYFEMTDAFLEFNFYLRTMENTLEITHD